MLKTENLSKNSEISFVLKPYLYLLKRMKNVGLNRGKLAFLPAASAFEVAQFLLRNYMPNFPNLGAF